MSLLIPVLSKTPNLVKELTKVLPGINFHQVTIADQDPHFKKSDILICDFDLLGPHLYTLPNAKWVQGTWAGIDVLTPLIEKSKPIPYTVTRFTGEHFGRIMSEYIIANIINRERDLLQIKSNQSEQKWVREGKIAYYRIISDLTMGILGLGNIGSRVGKNLHTFGAKILAFGRRPALPADDKYSHVSKYYTKESLPSFLKECDYVINVLPRTQETNGLLDNDMLKNCADKRSVFINVGRSNVVSEDSLINAIRNKWLSAAILDVFDEEPLPATSPLWKTEQIFITPHVSAMSRARDIAEQFCLNLELYKKSLPLPAVVDFTKGY